ncbi:MAG: methyltransferase domain-containing protein [Candidatus Woesearchaeota archaeon]
MPYYDDISAGYEELHGEEQRNKLRILAAELDVKRDNKLLDVGAGTGMSAQHFDCKWTGIEPSAGMIEHATEQIILGKGEELPFKDNQFDVVICVTALHNFDNPEKGLKEMIRVGKGKFGFSLLRSAHNHKELVLMIKHNFNVLKHIEEEKDDIFICSRPGTQS